MTLTQNYDQHKLAESIQLLLAQIKKKVGLRPSDVKQLAHVLLGILNSLFQNNGLNLVESMVQGSHKIVEELIDAALKILSTESMKVRNNIEFLRQDRFYAIDIQAFQDLCQIVDYLISAVNQLGIPESPLNTKLLEAQRLLFSSASVRLAGSLPL